MKKIFFFVAAGAAMMCSCTKDLSVSGNDARTVEPELVQMSFSASSEFTKTILNEDRSVAFKPGESIAVFAEGTDTPYEFTTSEGGTSAVFTGSAPSAGKYYAAFPYSSTLKLNGSTIEGFSLGTGSDGTGTGTYNSKKAIAVAVSDGDVLKFKQVCALLKVTVPASVTDLKEVVVFNRESGASNTAGALTGNFNVAVASDGTPSVTVTSAKFQAGFVGPSGSSVAVSVGDYYIPVLPAVLTDKKGIDLKITFMDNFIARGFNGVGVSFKSGKVYDLGTIVKSDSFVENGFESENALSGWTGNKNGSENAFSVVENPFKTATNSSAHVMKDDMSSSTTGTSGYVEFQSTVAAGYHRFPSGVRGFYNRIRVKMYLGTNAYYPRIKRASITPPWPVSINGVALNGADNAANKVIWDANVKTDDWNVLEWNASQMDSGWSSFQNLGNYQFRPFTTWDGKNVEGFDATTNNRCVYIDDITFVLK